MYIMRGPESETIKAMVSILLRRQWTDPIGKRELIKTISEERQISKVSAYKAYNILKASGIIREENVVFYELSEGTNEIHREIRTAVKIDYYKTFENHKRIKLRKYEDELNILGFSKDKTDKFLNLEEIRLANEMIERIKIQEEFTQMALKTNKKNKEEGELVWEYLRSLNFKYLSSYIDDWKAF